MSKNNKAPRNYCYYCGAPLAVNLSNPSWLFVYHRGATENKRLKLVGYCHDWDCLGGGKSTMRC